MVSNSNQLNNSTNLDQQSMAIASDSQHGLNLDAESLINSEMLDTVNVTSEQIDSRQRKISAKIQIPFPAERIWEILTDYETLADFIPNLSKSRLIDHPTGGIRLEQIGSQCLLNFQFCARVVLDMVESFPHQIDFCMVEGDFKVFEGNWFLQPALNAESNSTDLIYTVKILPRRLMPINLIEHRLHQNLRVNLVAIRQRADQLFG